MRILLIFALIFLEVSEMSKDTTNYTRSEVDEMINEALLKPECNGDLLTACAYVGAKKKLTPSFFVHILTDRAKLEVFKRAKNAFESGRNPRTPGMQAIVN